MLDKSFRDKTHEQAWCLYIDDNIVKEVMFSDKYNETETSVDFKCKSETNGLLHTHPVLTSSELSKYDEEFFLKSDSIDVTCVQSKIIENHHNAIRCWEKEDGKINEIGVLIDDR